MCAMLSMKTCSRKLSWQSIIVSANWPKDWSGLYLLTLEKNVLIFRCYFLRRAHSIVQTQFMRVLPSGTRFPTESTEAMLIMCLA